MSITDVKIKMIISKSNLLNKSEYSDDELEEYMTIIENESNLNRNEIYELIINEKIDYLVDNFKVIWTFIDKYDFININELKIKYKNYIKNRMDEIELKYINYMNNEKMQLYDKINELDGNVFLRYIGATNNNGKIEYVINKNDIFEMRILGDKMKQLIDNITIDYEPKHDNDIKGLPLTSLNLSNNDKITDDDIKDLQLTSLNLYKNNKITNDGIKGLPLTSLNLRYNNKITDDGIREMPLTSLNLSGNDKITDDGIRGLPLTSLDLTENNKITNDGIREMPLTSLDLYNNNKITDDGIRGMPLTELNLGMNDNITDDGIKGMLLTNLNLFRNNKITDNGIKNLPLTILILGNGNYKNINITVDMKNELIKKGCNIIE